MRYLKIFTIIFFAAFASCQSDSDQSKSHKESVITSDSLLIANAWARPGARGGNSAAYFIIKNGTDSADSLLSVQTDIAAKAEIHESFQENGLSGMRPAGAQNIEPNASLSFQPGGLHIMLMNLARDIVDDDSISISLTFKTNGEKTISVPVKSQMNQ